MPRIFFFSTLFCCLYGNAQQWKSVDFTSAHGKIGFTFDTKRVNGEADYEFDVLKPVDTVKLDAKGMEFHSVTLNGREVTYVNSGKELKIIFPFRKKCKKNRLAFSYSVIPKQALYFTGAEANRQVFTQGQGKYTSNWFPSIDDTNDKMVFSMEVDNTGIGTTALSNGTALAGNNASPSWRSFAMKKPMSSYLLMLAVGNFVRKTEISSSGIPLEYYLEPADSTRFEATYRHSKRIFDFLEQEIGVPYPWEVYRQIPVQDFLYGGMENTTTTIFARDYVVDDIGWNDRDYTNVNAHELAHQWFGDMVTAASDDHHWLQEGFATYYALLAEKDVFGDDYFHLKLYENAAQLARSGERKPVVGAGASSLIYYQKGGWALHALRDGLGAQNFRKAVKSYLKKYGFQNVTTEQFLAEVKKASPKFDVASFRKKWLDNPEFDMEEALRLLRKNAFMQRYFDVSALADKTLPEKKDIFVSILKSAEWWPIKEEIVYQLAKTPFGEKKEFLELALATNDVHVRQAVARTMGNISAASYPAFETLLGDPSYITKEIALNSLAAQFPDKRKQLFDKTKGVEGMTDKNIRILWLTLALKSKDYDAANNGAYYDELLRYASADYESNVRQNALTNLLFLDPKDANALQALTLATIHHKWQFTKFSRDKIRALIKKDNYRTFFAELLPKLPEAQRTAVDNLLKESK